MTTPAIIPPGLSTSAKEVSAATGRVLVGVTVIVVDGAIAAWEEVDDDGTDDVVVEGGGAVEVGARVVVVVGTVVVVVEGVVVEVVEVVGVVVVEVVVDDVGEGDSEPPLLTDSTSAIREPTT